MISTTERLCRPSLIGARLDPATAPDPIAHLAPLDRAQANLRAAWTLLGRVVDDLREVGEFSTEIRLTLLARDQVTAAGTNIARKRGQLQ